MIIDRERDRPVRVTSLTPHQHRVLHQALADVPLDERPRTSLLTKTTYSFDRRDRAAVADVVSLAIEKARTANDRGDLNALHSVARKLERLGVVVPR